MKRWYTLHTKPNSEYRVEILVRQHGVETYLPEIQSLNTPQKRQKTPLFPCYLFMMADLGVVDLSQLQWIPGLRRIVSFGDSPAPLPHETIDLIRRKLAEIDVAGAWPGHTFKPGDTVQITNGPLQGMLAIFDGPTTPAQRVQVLLTILGRVNRVQVAVIDLKEVSAGIEASVPKRPRRTRGRGRRIKKNNLANTKV